MQTTITEALAEVKTIEKRIEKKQQFIMTYIVRQDMIRDPLEKDGGAREVLKREMQAIADLRERTVAIRRAVADANARETIAIDGQARTIADWLTWRREVAPKVQAFLAQITQRIGAIRTEARNKGFSVVAGNAQAQTPQDIIVAVDEKEIAERAEEMEGILGKLDGLLSLKNATVTIEV